MRLIYSNKFKVVVEQPPSCRSVKIVSNRFNLNRNFFLSFPYVVYALDKKDFILQVGFRNKPTNKKDFEDGGIYLPPLPNVYSDDLETCLGDNVPESAKEEKWDIRKMISVFWQSTFIEDEESWVSVDSCYSSFSKVARKQAIHPRFKDTPSEGGYYIWEALSKKDPNFVLKMDWPKPRAYSRDSAKVESVIDFTFVDLNGNQNEWVN